MAYTIPTFNLSVNIWTRTVIPPRVDPPRLTCMGNLAWGRRVNVQGYNSSQTSGLFTYTMLLMVPKLTDIRWNPATTTDTVEVPAGSGRYYQVLAVDDIGKGFANEHRAAILYHDPAVSWPIPIP